MTVQIVSIDPPRSVVGKTGAPRRVAIAQVRDDTGTVNLSLWNDQIGSCAVGDTVTIEQGYISLVRGVKHLNIGPGGRLRNGGRVFTWGTAKPPAGVDRSAHPPSVPAQVIIREIVKVPCRYCGFLNPNTDSRCSSCGAPTK